MLRDFGKIHRYLRRSDANSDTIEDSTRDQHSSPVACNLERGSHEPEDTGVQEGIATTELVGDGSSDD
jgi:hypothetical protein